MDKRGWEAWTARADHDFTAIALLRAADSPPWDIVAFHAQQGAEKYLKAFLVSRDQQPPKIHDLTRLVQLCAALEPTLAQWIESAAVLSPLAVFSRYPESGAELTRDDAELGVDIAERIRDAVLPLLRRT